MTNQQFIKYKINGVTQQNHLASLSGTMSNHSGMSDPVTITVYADRLVSNRQIFLGPYSCVTTWYCDADTTITGIQNGSKIYTVGQTLNFNDYGNSNYFYVLMTRTGTVTRGSIVNASVSVVYNGETIHAAAGVNS